MATALEHAELGDPKAAAVVFKALGSDVRLRILTLLADDPLTMTQLRSDRTLPGTVEQHVQTLQHAGLVEQLPGIAPRPWRIVPGSLPRAAAVVTALGGNPPKRKRPRGKRSQ